jgi:toxin ParE1/3/4
VSLYWTPEALADRREIYDYIETDDPAAALSLDEQFAAFAERLAAYPYLGRPGRVTGTRELVAHHNYLLIYDIAAGNVRVLRVLHSARQWPVT